VRTTYGFWSGLIIGLLFGSLLTALAFEMSLARPHVVPAGSRSVIVVSLETRADQVLPLTCIHRNWKPTLPPRTSSWGHGSSGCSSQIQPTAQWQGKVGSLSRPGEELAHA
jgi:hypothetical protein